MVGSTPHYLCWSSCLEPCHSRTCAWFLNPSIVIDALTDFKQVASCLYIKMNILPFYFPATPASSFLYLLHWYASLSTALWAPGCQACVRPHGQTQALLVVCMVLPRSISHLLLFFNVNSS